MSSNVRYKSSCMIRPLEKKIHMTTGSLKSYLESLSNCDSSSSMVSTDDDDSGSRVELLKKLIRQHPDELDCYASVLRNNLFLRNVSPLLINDFVGALIICGEGSIRPICDLLLFLPACLRPMETYTFCMESWVDLHQQSCRHEERVTGCRIALARSVIASMVTDLITRTEKGPLFRNRVDYLMSFGMQLMSKYFNASPIHANNSTSNDRMATNLLKIAESMSACAKSNNHTDIGHSLESEVCIKLLASLVQFRFRAKLDHTCLDIIELLRRIDSAVINAITTRLEILQPSTATEDTGGYEVSDYDIAVLVVGVDGILPLIWSPKKRSLHMLDACNLLLETGQESVRVALTHGINYCSNFPGSLRSPAVVKFLRLSIETATSVGDEELLSLSQRQSVYTAISKTLSDRPDPMETIQICLEIVRETRIDSCAGIFVKIAKDVEQKIESEMTSFYSFAHSVFDGETVDVINTTDSLKSILNWARLLYIAKSVRRDKKEDEWFGEVLNELTTQLNPELPDAELHNRISFIAHLVDRVKELMK